MEYVGRVPDVRNCKWAEFLENGGEAVITRGYTTLLEQVRVFVKRQKVSEDLSGVPERRERVENGYW